MVVLICVCMRKCGFIIHSKLGWLGTSPDGRVTDPSSQHANGIVEFKCHYAYRDCKRYVYKNWHIIVH